MTTAPPNDDDWLLNFAEQLSLELGIPPAELAKLLLLLSVADEVWGADEPEDGQGDGLNG